MQEPKDKKKGQVMTDFMKWAYADGQKYCADLGYAPLPPSVAKLAVAALVKIE
jgi:ABC-type phosphate transport system substrate-binding protein